MNYDSTAPSVHGTTVEDGTEKGLGSSRPPGFENVRPHLNSKSFVEVEHDGFI